MNWFFLAILSAIFSAFSAIFQKKILKHIPALEFSFLLSFIGLFWGTALLFNSNWYEIDVKTLFLIIFDSIIGALAFLNVMEALKRMDISKALPLLTTTPFFVAIFAFIFLGEKLSIQQIFGLIFLIGGVFLLDLKFEKKSLLPFLVLLKSTNRKYIFFALLFFTLSALLDKYIIVKSSLTPISYVGYKQLFTFLIFSIILRWKKVEIFSLIKSQKSKIWFNLFIISIFTIIYRVTQISAIEIASVGLVLAVKRLSVLFATFFGGKYFREENQLSRNFAVIIILISILLITIR